MQVPDARVDQPMSTREYPCAPVRVKLVLPAPRYQSALRPSAAGDRCSQALPALVVALLTHIEP